MSAPGTPVDLRRNPELAAAGTYDLAIVGGGIQGATLALEAARRGLSTLLLERGDFGGATSWNSLRILHGGLRYLQGLDLRRFRESVGERRWFLREFPDLVEPLPCLMPLYHPPRGGALRRPLALRGALAADALLRGGGDPGLPASRLLDAGETAGRLPGVDPEGLAGGALWHDAVVPDSQRLVVEILRWAAACGARALNYVEALDLRLSRGGGRVVGLRAEDRLSGARLLFNAKAVINGAGPWCRQVARRFDRDVPGLFRPVLAWNILLDREPLAPLAVAAAAPTPPDGPKAQTFFLLPWKGKTLAGTAYAVPATDAIDPADPEHGAPGPEAVHAFLGGLNAALPALAARPEQVLRVFWGWLPGEAPGVPAGRPVIYDHGSPGGPRGLVSVSGVKLTTARALAVRALETLFKNRLPAPRPIPRPAADAPWSFDELLHRAESDPAAARGHLRGLAERQAVVHLEDLLLRRTDWGILPARALLAERLCQTLGWAADDAAPRRAAGGLP